MELVEDVNIKERIGYKVIFKQKEFMKLIIASAVNRFGDSIDTVAFMMLVYVLTKDPTWSAIIFAVNCIPTIFISPFVSGLVEGMNHKRVMVITDIIRGICVGYISIGYAYGLLKPWMLVAITIVISTVEAFGMPANMALTPKVLDKKYYDFGISLKSSLGKVIELIGAAMAGMIISILGLSVAIGIDMITFFISAIFISTIKIEKVKSKKSKIDIKGYISLLKEGYRYIRSKKLICNLIMISPIFGAMYIPFNTMIAPLVDEVLGTSYTIISVISATLTIGMLFATVVYPYIARKISGKMYIAIACVTCSVLYIGYVLVGTYVKRPAYTYIIIAIISFMSGAGAALVQSFINIEFMKNVEKEYLARSSAVYSAIAMATTPIVSFLVGIIVKKISVKMLFVGSGVFALLFALCLLVSKISLEKIEE